MLRTFISHTLVPTLGIPKYPLSTFAMDLSFVDFETWFRNAHNAGMLQQLMQHNIEAWEGCLQEEGRGCIDKESERESGFEPRPVSKDTFARKKIDSDEGALDTEIHLTLG